MIPQTGIAPGSTVECPTARRPLIQETFLTFAFLSRRAAAVALAIGLIAAACGDDTPAATTTIPAATTAAPEAAPSSNFR